jgi:predicted Zn-dependent protease
LVEAPRPELYDLERDPREETNVYAPWDANVQKLRSSLADLQTGATPVSATAATISQSTLEELKALGYLTRADTATSTNVAEPSLLPDPKDKIEEQNLLHRAMIAAEDGRSAEARAALEEVVTLDPKSALALAQLGALELQSEEYSRAVRHLALARQLRPTDSILAFEQARASEGNGDLSGAKEALEASLKLNPTYFQARLLLGKIDLERKDLKAAEDEFEAALLLQPENKEALLGKAKTLFAAGKFLEVVRQLEPMARAQSSDVAVFELLAQTYAALGETEKAEQSKIRAKTMRGTPRP